VLDAATIETLAAGGLDGLEVDHQDHDHAARAGLRRLAAEFDLAVTGSSDYHGTGKTGHDLGVNTTAPQQWERLADRAGTDRSAGVRGA
ncbi:MAG: PHP domain-containing protein, partial [Jiangellaceae bacterium]